MPNTKFSGGSPATASNQNLSAFSTKQGTLPLDYLGKKYISSYNDPSSSNIPSSIDMPNPYYSQPQQSPHVAQMLKLLKGR